MNAKIRGMMEAIDAELKRQCDDGKPGPSILNVGMDWYKVDGVIDLEAVAREAWRYAFYCMRAPSESSVLEMARRMEQDAGDMACLCHVADILAIEVFFGDNESSPQSVAGPAARSDPEDN